MRNRLSPAALSLRLGLLVGLLLGLLFGGTLGCGRSPGHVSVSVGDSARLDLDRGVSGPTSVKLTLGAHDCRPARFSMAWQDLFARLSAC